MLLLLDAPAGQSWAQLGHLGLAFVLSALIGFERELRQKAAGLRTLTVVGFAAALFMVISQAEFGDSRVAAQVVSGLGFIGGGLIFVRRDAVRGLTTAAVVWLTAAVGMAAGAGLWLFAIAATAAHFLVAYGFTPLAHRLSGRTTRVHSLTLTYRDGEGVLRRALAECTERGFTVRDLATAAGDGGDGTAARQATVRLSVEGAGPVTGLAAWLADLDGVLAVTAGDPDEEAD
ncbi:MgtC/SapB family protein [Blastococcus xanthinilyticus]|uniref:Putative Mg2+ transporter-C (MgtC) family protein n=1 Tax=Blastococcus xanthinilyticus TaxID=1564164 RepID=A0A5S5D3G2_9ACTN|nr:MgtC/SapB family protein [Blastococcus xanthinilyticus]TYP89808.1 putative Mg2+ transporter-C (MgtC) family protein [Blastococcus xanthinilyticus]